jgi:hypothetical protein
MNTVARGAKYEFSVHQGLINKEKLIYSAS